MHNSFTKTTRKGFTLVEVMMAAFVLATALLGSLTALMRAFDMLDTARNTTLAGQVIQSEIEDIRLRPWNSLPASGSIDLTQSIGSTLSEADRAALNGRFSASRSVEPVAGREADFKRITVSVSWTDYGNRTHVRRYETLLGRNGLSDYFVTIHTPTP